MTKTGHEIRQDQTDALDSIEINDSESGASFRILPSFGGNIAGLTLSVGGDSLTVIDGYRTHEAAQANKGYRGAFLFPFPNRIRDGKYQFERVSYQLPINRPKEHNAIHGFFTNRAFELVSQQTSDHSGSIIIKSTYDGSYSGFPFPCEIMLEFCLYSPSEFRSTVSVTNIGESNMPVGFGWHPYFSLDCPVDELSLKLPESELLLADQKNIPTGVQVPNSQFQALEPIKCSLFDTAFALKGKETESITELFNKQAGWYLRLAQTTGAGGYNYLQVYIPPDRRTIALEPMTCPANAFNSGEGLISLAPDQTSSSSFSISLTRRDH